MPAASLVMRFKPNLSLSRSSLAGGEHEKLRSHEDYGQSGRGGVT